MELQLLVFGMVFVENTVPGVDVFAFLLIGINLSTTLSADSSYILYLVLLKKLPGVIRHLLAHRFSEAQSQFLFFEKEAIRCIKGHLLYWLLTQSKFINPA